MIILYITREEFSLYKSWDVVVDEYLWIFEYVSKSCENLNLCKKEIE